MSLENYEEDLEELKCNDCKRLIGFYLPDLCQTYAVCELCMTANKYRNEDKLSEKLEKLKKVSK
tara:strand:- start:230 stop:421 length:192 start_codon:yes stop_codon:yes gene_type:complete